MLKKVKSRSLTMWAVLVKKVFYQRVISYVSFGNRTFKIQDATALRKRWPGKSLERGRRCKRGKFMLRFATRLGQYQYINPYKGFDEETKIGCLPKNSIITATLLGGRNYRRRTNFQCFTRRMFHKIFHFSTRHTKNFLSKTKILPNAKLIFASIKGILQYLLS